MEGKMFSAVNNFFNSSQLISQIKDLVNRQTSQTGSTPQTPARPTRISAPLLHHPSVQQANCIDPTAVTTTVTPSTPTMVIMEGGNLRTKALSEYQLPRSESIEMEAKKFNYTTTRHSNVSKSQLKEFREAFRLFDKNGDGSITKEELGTVMRSLGQFARTEELKVMLQEIDADGDGNVSFDEFVDIAFSVGGDAETEVISHEQEEKELRDAFRVFDKHNRGYITASDLRAVLQCLGEDLSEEEIEEMIKEVDVDGDGRIDFYEFVYALGEPGQDDGSDDDEEDVEYGLQ